MKCCSLLNTVIEYIANKSDDKNGIEIYIQKNLDTASVEEIHQVFQYINKQDAWDCGQLRKLFLDYLEHRWSQFCFYINIAYIPDESNPSGNWLTQPKVWCQVACDDGFHILDADGEPITKVPLYRSYSIGNSSFVESDAQVALKMLSGIHPYALIRQEADQTSPLVIYGLMSPNQKEKVYTIAVPEESQTSYGLRNVFAYPMDTFHDEEVGMIYQIYNSIRYNLRNL